MTIRETIPDLETVRYSYFEPNEGKAQSDTLGALAKGAADRETWHPTRMERSRMGRNEGVGNMASSQDEEEQAWDK